VTAHPDDEVLSAQLDGALGEAEAAGLKRHLATCHACGHRLELLAATARAIAELPAEPLPRPLDLGFLSPAAAVDPLVLPGRARWRPPPWAAPVLAAAAVLVAAVSFGPGLLPHGGGASTATAGQSGGLRQNFNADSGASPGAGPGGAGAVAAPALGAPAPGGNTTGGSAAVPGAATTEAVSGQAFPGSGNAVVKIDAGQATVRAGQAESLTLLIAAGSSRLDVQRSTIIVRRNGASQQVAGAGTDTVPPGAQRSISGTWIAGTLGAAPATPGDYLVEGDVMLTDGRDLAVSLTVHVT
jgi:hypothetical protein